MANTCANCFFYKPITSRCLCKAPQLVVPHSVDEAWPQVDPGDWCGEGVDAGTGMSFAPGIKDGPKIDPTTVGAKGDKS